MTLRDPVIVRELPVIWQIIQDETWLEGERRGCPVRTDDRVVRERVCAIILRIGQQLRDAVSASLAKQDEARRLMALSRASQDYNEAA